MNPFKLALLLTVTVVLSACGSITTAVPTSIAVPASVVVSPGYSVSVFAQAPGLSATPPTCGATSPGCFTKPDSIVQLGTGAGATIFVAYGDALKPNGAISATNTAQGTVQIVQYDLNGNQLKTYTVTGHNDGMMTYDSHTIWAMSNEDSNPLLSVIDTTTGIITTYSDDATPTHGGGFDDMQKIGSNVFVSASAPKPDATGNYSAPAIVSLVLNPINKTFHTTPVLAGNATAQVLNPLIAGITVDALGNAVLGKPVVPKGVATNPAGLQDPDSMSIDPSGNLVLDSPADSLLVFVANPGMPGQSVKELFLTLYSNHWPIDDTRWAPASSQFMLLTDTGGNIYKVTKTVGFATGDMYSAGHGMLLQVNSTTGFMTPITTGMYAPQGMLFVL